jgi:lysophospholipase L1-like esterase
LGVAVTTYVVMTQAHRLRGSIPIRKDAPECDGLYGEQFSGIPVEFALIGDSSAAGVGVTRADQTPGAVLAGNLAESLQRPVRLRCFAVPGAQSADLAEQIPQVLGERTDVTLIFIGANDITHRSRPAPAVKHLEAAVRELVGSGIKVVVGTCPDLSAMQGMQPPLRWVTQFWCRELAAAQTIAAVRAGARTVSLADTLRAEFGSRPHELYAEDRFHPSAAGYLRACEAVLPTLVNALGYSDELMPTPSSRWSLIREPRRGIRKLAAAAVRAADTAGTEVSEVPSGRRGLWVELRNRVAEATALARQQLPGRGRRRDVDGHSVISVPHGDVEVAGNNGELIR